SEASALSLHDALPIYNLLKRGDAPVEYYLELAEVHKRNGDSQAVLNTLHHARTKFPENKQVLMNLVQLFAQRNEYKAIAQIIDRSEEHASELQSREKL